MRRTGGIAKEGHRNKDISDGNVYWSMNYAILVMEHLQGHLPTGPLSVFDSCSNNLVLGKAIQAVVGKRVVSLEGQDKAIDGFDALTFVPKTKPNVIVCNPPWKESFAKPLFFHLRDILAEDGVLFFNINNVFLYQGWERAVELKCCKYYFLPRYVFKHCGRPLLDCGFAVYHKGMPPYPGLAKSVYIHLPRESA